MSIKELFSFFTEHYVDQNYAIYKGLGFKRYLRFCFLNENDFGLKLFEILEGRNWYFVLSVGTINGLVGILVFNEYGQIWFRVVLVLPSAK